MDKFSQYVRSSSFRIDLSQKMITCLLSHYHYSPEVCTKFRLKLADWTLSTERALRTRGLLGGYGSYLCALTEAGRKLCELIVLGGYTLGTDRFHQFLAKQEGE